MSAGTAASAPEPHSSMSATEIPGAGVILPSPGAVCRARSAIPNPPQHSGEIVSALMRLQPADQKDILSLKGAAGFAVSLSQLQGNEGAKRHPAEMLIFFFSIHYRGICHGYTASSECQFT